LPARNKDIAAWNSLSPQEKKLYARFFEVYAGYLTYTDYEIGRLLEYLEKIKQLDNTIIFLIIGDNGASKEGTFHGAINKELFSRSVPDSIQIKNNLELIGEIGTPEGNQTNYPLGWAQAANTPFKYWKQDANSEGGTHNPLIVYYPKKITGKGEIRTQYGHVIDLLPTTLEFIGLKAPGQIRGIKQDTIQGTSLVYSFGDKNAPSRHTDQYYYIFGSRSIYKDGWKAEVYHHPDIIDLTRYSPTPVKDSSNRDFSRDVWELYHLDEDFNEQFDLAGKNPQKLAELQAIFDAEARKYNIYPMIDWEDVFRRRIHVVNYTPVSPSK
jgi:arylsulfatase